MIDNVTTDNMSNEEVIETLKGIVFNGFDRTTRKERQALDLAIKALEDRPQGEWIVQPHSMIMKCSLCGNEETAKDVGTINPDKHFCSFCDADMGGKEE